MSGEAKHITLLTKEGDIHVGENDACLVFRRDGTIIFYVKDTRDISDLGNMELSLMAIINAIEKRDNPKGILQKLIKEFANDVAKGEDVFQRAVYDD